MTRTRAAIDAALPSNRRAFLGNSLALASAIAVTATYAAAVPTDGELLSLGERFEHAWAHEAACWRAFPSYRISREDDARLWTIAEAAADATGALIHEIEQHRATTVAGLIVNLRACSHCHSGEPFDGTFLHDGGGRPTTDFRLAEQILRDLMALDGRPVPLSNILVPGELTDA